MTPSGLVHEAAGGVYRVRFETNTWVDASLRGRLKLGSRQDRVVIGDRVRVALTGAGTVIEGVLPRRNVLIRQGGHRRQEKVVAANLDRVVVVMSARDPDLSLGYLDRMLAVCEASGIPGMVVINKQDLPGARAVSLPVRNLYRKIGYDVLLTSAESDMGVERLRALVRRGTCVLVGPSGTGKSSLLNRLDPSLELRTGELSARTRTGRHTTVASRLLAMPNRALVADTPGFGDVAPWGVSADRVSRCFTEIRTLGRGCRFRSCSHVHEPDCAVREAVTSGEVADSRYAHYQALLKEVG